MTKPDPIADRKDLQDELAGLCRRFGEQEQMTRRLEVIEASQQRFYDKGYQHVWWNESMGLFALASGSGVVAGAFSDGSTNMPHYVEDYNIFGPYGRISSSVLCQNPPGLQFMPNDPGSAVDIEAARAAETYRKYVDRIVNRKAIQSQVASRFWTDGRTIIMTCSDDDGLPAMHVFGVLESKVPITSRRMADWHYCLLSDDIDINVAKDMYPDAADEMSVGSTSLGESAYERYARLGAMQGTNRRLQPGDAYQHLVTRQRIWLRPSAFNAAEEECREELRGLYPDGALAIFCGGAYCRSYATPMEDSLSLAHPKPGDGMNRPSLGKDCIALQDAVNDYKNQEKEYYDYGIGATWVNSEICDNAAVREQISQPGNRYSAPMSGGRPLGENFFIEPPAACPPGLVEAYQDMRGAFAQFVLSAPPAIFGGSDPANETASGIGLLRDQAMGQASLPWQALQSLFASAYSQAIRRIAREQPRHTARVEGRRAASPVLKASAADIASGKFHCHPSADSSFPETWAARRGVFMQLFEASVANPTVGQIINQPDNLEMARELLGLPDLVIPGAESRDKQLGEIEELLATTPVPPPPQVMQAFAMASAVAQQHGAPPPPPPQPQPSVPIDEIFDLHQFEFEKCQQWLGSQERRDEDAAGNSAGVMNVRLHALLHFAQLQKAAAPAPPAPKPLSLSLSANIKDLEPGAQKLAEEKLGVLPPAPAQAPGPLPSPTPQQP